MKRWISGLFLILAPVFLRAENDFWLVPAHGRGRDQVRVIQGGNAGIRLVDIGEEADETDDQGVHWRARYELIWRTKAGYALTRHLWSYQDSSVKNFVKAFDNRDRVRFSLGPIAEVPLAMSDNCSHLVLGHVTGPELSRTADYLLLTDGNGRSTAKITAPMVSTHMRLSPSGDWLAYMSDRDLVMLQISANKEYRRSLAEVANASGSPMVKQFEHLTDDGLLKYRFKTVSAYQEQQVNSDIWTKTYDPKEGAPATALSGFQVLQAPQGLPPVTDGLGSKGQIVAKGWPIPVGHVGSYNLYMSSVSGSGYRKVNDAPITEPTYAIRGVEAGRRYFFVLSAVTNDVPPVESAKSAEWSMLSQAAP
jgi:hypothetical protein